MIKSDNRMVSVEGTPMELIQDFVNIMTSFRNVFTNKMDRERADEIISLCGRYVYAEDELEEMLYAERLAEVLLNVKDVDMG